MRTALLAILTTGLLMTACDGAKKKEDARTAPKPAAPTAAAPTAAAPTAAAPTAAAPTAAAPTAAAPTAASPGLAKRVSVRSSGKVVPGDAEHGDVVVELADGQTLELTHDGMATDAKLASDGRTVGFVALAWATYEGRRELAREKLLLFRDGTLVASVTPEKVAEVDWKFEGGGQQIAVSSAGMNGPSYLQLFDVASGRLVASADPNDPPTPAWADGLDVR